MKAACWIRPNTVKVEEVPDPSILNRRDAIVKITSTAICGSDLHLYDGYIPTMKRGDILGHEFMGEIVEVGKAVTNLQVEGQIGIPIVLANARTRDIDVDPIPRRGELTMRVNAPTSWGLTSTVR